MPAGRLRGLCQAGLVALAVPEWVEPAEQQLVDCRRLVTGGGRFEAGVAAALGWVLGTGRSPITGADVPASAQTAEEEFFVAGKVELGESPLSAVIPAELAQGVGRTLAWLLGWEPRSPIDLPRRPVPTAEQLYEEAVTAEPWRYRLPEEQAAGRLAAQREAARLARLAALGDAPSR
jgi:hypothetical protein